MVYIYRTESGTVCDGKAYRHALSNKLITIPAKDLAQNAPVSHTAALKQLEILKETLTRNYSTSFLFIKSRLTIKFKLQKAVSLRQSSTICHYQAYSLVLIVPNNSSLYNIDYYYS